ncbi:MAG: anti-sigma regulatory factor [Candidatus Viridilinea halotolerans]|uniref:Anti-sigma regulatory factor n=1 Tax=Candidatus Viridilinea halotolerans TaxID=2491704 RepID=A0A426U272_9CHLR|nr:MAG: anti-sigma regulatory factor [Candidatus Viridilinea halotolerans]
MPAPVSCSIMREVDVYVAMSHARELATELGFGATDRTRIEIVVLELTRNLLVHAGGGTLTFDRLHDPAHGIGLVVEALDQGPGIVNIDLALQDGYSTAHTLGSGLPGVRRLMDDFHITSTVGVGTHVRAVKWLQQPQRRAIYGC